MTAVVIAGLIFAPAAVAQAAPTDARLTALADLQLPDLQSLVQDLGGLGAFRAGTSNVVMLPAEKATRVDTLTTTLLGSLPGALVDLRISRFTTDALKAVSRELDSREETGIPQQYGFIAGYDPESDTLRFETDAPASFLAPLVNAHPGQVSTTQGSFRPWYDRFHDTSPYYGAVALVNGVRYPCTGGVALADPNGKRYLTSAAHCYRTGESINVSGNNNHVGKVEFRNTSLDTVLLYSDPYPQWHRYDGGIWSGGSASSQSSIAVAGVQAPKVGQRNVRLSGAKTFNTGDKEITQVGISFCLPTTDSCVEGGNGFRWAGAQPGGPGDSGAPVFTVDRNNKAVIIGMVSGGGSKDSSGRVTGIGVTINSVLSTYTLKIVTG